MIPIDTALSDENVPKVLALGFAYVVIVSGWIGYSRSVSMWAYRDSVSGITRFVLDLIILFECFYLLWPSQTNHFWQFPYVVFLIFFTYIISDIIKRHEYHTPKSEWARIKTRTKTTVRAFFSSGLIVIVYYAFTYVIGFGSYFVELVISFLIACTILVIGYRVAKWEMKERRVRT